jgi:hypothetical protein
MTEQLTPSHPNTRQLSDTAGQSKIAIGVCGQLFILTQPLNLLQSVNTIHVIHNVFKQSITRLSIFNNITIRVNVTMTLEPEQTISIGKMVEI